MASVEGWEAVETANEWHIGPVGPLLPGLEIGQAFLCRGSGLHRLELLLANYERRVEGEALARLREDGPDGPLLFQQRFDTRRVADNSWQSFDFPPQTDSSGKRYYFSLLGLSSIDDRHITAWHHPKLKLAGGDLYRKGRRLRRGTLSLRTYTLSNEPVLQRFRKFRSAFTAGDADYDGHPLQLFVEVTSKCNLRCIMCRDRDGSVMVPEKAGSLGFMDFKLFEQLAPVLESVFTVNLFGWGEPLMHPEFIRFIEFTREHNPDCRITFNTNGTLLKTELARRLVELDVTRICFSLDSPDRETYERIRRGAKFDRVMANIEQLRTFRDSRLAAGSPSNLHLAAEQVVMKPNIRQLPEFLRLLGRLDIRELYLEQLYGPFPDLRIESLDRYLDTYRAARDVALELEIAMSGPIVLHYEELLTREEKGEAAGTGKGSESVESGGLEDDGRVHAANCPEPWQTVFVERTGNVIPCCFQQNCTELGRFPQQTLEEIWQGEGYRRLREGVVAKPWFPGCDNCIARGLPPEPVFSREWMNSVELVTPAAGEEAIPVEVLKEPPLHRVLAGRVVRRLRRMAGGGAKR